MRELLPVTPGAEEQTLRKFVLVGECKWAMNARNRNELSRNRVDVRKRVEKLITDFLGCHRRMCVATANDLKLSDSPARRGPCAEGGKAEAGSTGRDAQASSLQRMVRRSGDSEGVIE